MTGGQRGSLPQRALVTTLLLAITATVQAGAAKLRTAARASVWSVLRTTRLAKLVSFYRHFAFNLPRSTTTAGVAVLLGIAAIRLYLLAEGGVPTYLGGYFALIGALATLAVLAMLTRRRMGAVRFGWALGSLVALATLAMYIVSRTLGLPLLDQYVGRWEYTLGTFGMVLSAAFLCLHFAVITKLTVAFPEHQQWHD